MKGRFDRVLVSSLLMTVCLVSLVPSNLKSASTWQQRVFIFDNVARYNYESLLAFASLALVVIGLTVVWTGFHARLRSAWFIMFVITWVYFFPVYLVDAVLESRRIGWPYGAALVQEALEGRPFAQTTVRSIAILVVMLISLLLPLGDFFGKKARGSSSRGESAE
jgi:hypothetical protein